MLFMTIFQYEPQNRDEIVKRRSEKGGLVPEGVKVVGEWSCVKSGQVFRLVDSDDSAAMMAATFAWSDLGKVEIHPVMETDEVMKVLASG